jgi:guanyl-specific ribonuclease Sa
MNRLRFLLFAFLLPTIVVTICSAGCDLITTFSNVNGSTISIHDLPNEALDTIELIQNGGPYPYSQDGDVYYNREGLLAKQPDGYYHVYTVETPGTSDRGDRRIVTGKGGEFYYTDDHYASFSLITGISGVAGDSTQNQQTTTSKVGIKEINVNDLPPEARETLRLIKNGGPFPYKQDNTVFSNYEGLLPKQPSGYYREYTVVTPGESNRGARRIVAGVVGEYYYTADHYASFKRIVE